MLSGAFISFSVALLISILIGLYLLFASKHEYGEYDWKEFGKSVIYGLVLGIAAFIGYMIRGGD